MEVQERRYYEYVNTFHENDCMTLIDATVLEKGKNNVPLMMYVTAQVRCSAWTSKARRSDFGIIHLPLL